MAQALKPGYDFCTVDSFDGRIPGLGRLAIVMLVDTGPSIQGITKDRFRDYLRTGCPDHLPTVGLISQVTASDWLLPYLNPSSGSLHLPTAVFRPRSAKRSLKAQR